ncbi:hypothetical protein SR870_08630 [Rhodopseudomonas palustris]|uniref:hypothetical protein n=1 Tax=Rhodopseudomonas palustris TaxID=1076 RepID=UPI002ACEB655|nr:hypothetical protein [Rhodopseudomonas palustris]WQH01322.1 hypothetical protein SR870_08630 [Rhodopseudomonas palustris]
MGYSQHHRQRHRRIGLFVMLERRRRIPKLEIVAVLTFIAAAVVGISANADPLPPTPTIQSERMGVESAVRALLTVAQKGPPFTTPRGVKRTPIVAANEQVGTLWEDVTLKSLQPGNFWQGGRGIRVELLHEDRVVGVIHIDED